MQRRRHLIVYDIADSGRLRRVAKVMEAYGTRLQYSVFVCDLSRGELAQWHMDIKAEVDLAVDSIVWIDIGSLDATSINCLGRTRQPPPQGPLVF